MNKHAYLIMTHGAFEELLSLLQLIDDDRNDIFIHIDKKVNTPPYSAIQQIVKHSAVYFTERIDVSWGGYTQVKCEMILFEAAAAQGSYKYYHLLSGVDIPVKSQDYIHVYCNHYDGLNFITPARVREAKHDPARTAMRCEQYHLLQDRFIGKKRNVAKYIDFASCYLQRAVGIRRSRSYDFHLSYTWVSLTDSFIRYLISRKHNIEKIYKYTYCADEIFCISELLNSPFSDTIAPQGNLRYVEWKQYSNRDTSPRPLEISDLPKLENPDILFARKFILPESEDVLTALQQNW